VHWLRESRSSETCVGGAHEWHLDFVNAFRHITFHLGAWLCQPAVVIAPFLFHPRFVAIAAVSNSMGGDGVE
jgi:hypothetical protein